MKMVSSKEQAQQILDKILALLVWMADDFQPGFMESEIRCAADAVVMKLSLIHI